MGTMTNPKDPEALMAAAIIRLVQNDSDLNAMLDGRISVAEPAEMKDEPLPLMCFRLYGAGGDPLQGHHVSGMQVWAFSSKSYLEASNAYRLFRNVVNGVRLSRDGVYGVAREVRGPTWNYEPVNEDYTVTTLWTMQYTEPVQD